MHVFNKSPCIPLVLLFTLGISGCNGGGGGGSSTSAQALVYTGNTNPTVITTDNSKTLAANVIGSSGTGLIVAAGIEIQQQPVQSPDLVQLGPRLSNDLRTTLNRVASNLRSSAQSIVGVSVDQTLNCDLSGTVSVSGITASMVPAWHTAAPPSSVGFVVGFSSGFKIYHAGDTSIFSDMALIKTLYEPQLCLIPVGGLYTMDDRAASIACREYLKPQYAIPMHYPANPRETPSDECAQRFSHQLQGSGTEVIIMKPGETVSF